MLKAWSFVWLALPAFCFAQGDALVAKNIERVIADQSIVWAIADSGTSYSRINLFATPPEITTRKIEEGVGINFGIGRSKSLL